MISAERIMGYGQLESEAPLETIPPHKKPPPEWPERGEIVLEDVSFSYSPTLPLVLKFLCIRIKPSEKVQFMTTHLYCIVCWSRSQAKCMALRGNEVFLKSPYLCFPTSLDWYCRSHRCWEVLPAGSALPDGRALRNHHHRWH